MGPWSKHAGRLAWTTLIALSVWVSRGEEGLRGIGTDYIITVWDSDRAELPQYSFTSIAATPDGYLWLASFGSLSRFDGQRFTVYDPSTTPALPSGIMVKVYVDSRGSLWVGTAEGIARRTGGRWESFRKGAGWPGGTAHTITEAGDGSIWANADHLAVQLEGKEFVPRPVPGQTNGTTLCAADAEGVIWAMSGKVLARRDQDRWLTLPTSDSENLLGIGRAHDGGVWVVDGLHVYRAQGSRWVETRERPAGFRGDAACVLEDSRRNLWLGCYNHGVVVFRPDGSVLKCTSEDGLGNNSTLSLFEDPEGQIWVGSNGGGIARFRARTFDTYSERAGLSQTLVNSLAEEAPGQFLVATHGGGIVPFQGGRFGAPLTSPTNVAPGAPTLTENSWVHSLVREQDGTVWAGAYGGGLFRIRGRSIEPVEWQSPGDPTVTALYLDRSGRLWVGGRTSLAVREGGRFIQYGTGAGLTGRPIRAICQDDSGHLWTCGDRGAPLRQEGDRFVPYKVPVQGAFDASTFCAGRDGAFWIASYSRKLVRLKGGTHTVYSENEGVPVENVEALLEDLAGNLWLASDTGIARLTRASLDAVASGTQSHLDGLLFDRGDGLRTTLCRDNFQPNCLRAADGRLWFATVKGLSVVDPSRVFVKSQLPKTWIEDLRADGKELMMPESADGPVMVPAGTKRLQLHYTGINLGTPESVQFQHRLEPLDADWVDAGTERSVQLQDLRPGPYRFHVRSRSKEGIWSPSEATVALEVKAFYWQTAWFRASGGLVLVGLVGLSVWQIQSRRSRREWERREQERSLAYERAQAQSLARAKEAVEEAFQRFESVIENTPLVAIQGFDRGGVIQHWNAASQTLYGRTKQEALGRRVQDILIARDELEHFDQQLEAIWTSGRAAQPREWAIQTKLGGERWVYSSMFPVQQAGKTVEVFCMDVDITERKRLEVQLQQARKMQAIGQLAGGVAHDFNNILTVIQGHVSILLEEKAASVETAESIAAVAEAATRAAGLTRQLLAFSRRQVLQVKPLDLNEVLENIAKMIRRLLGEHVLLELRYAPVKVWTQADVGMMEQIVVNLAVNARDAMPSGGTMTISTDVVQLNAAEAAANPDAREGTFACLTVTDSGEGMDASTLAHLFEPFFTTKAVGKGTGLGLPTVYGIVAQHEGWIEVTSAPKAGSTFRVLLPACPPPEAGSEAVPAAQPAAVVRGGSEVILVVEDEEPVRKLAGATLVRHGYEVLLAHSGPEALQLWQQHGQRVDLLLTDMVMPGGVTGRELALRLQGEKPGLKVIYTSGYSVEMVRGDLQLEEARNYLAKPFDPVRLAQLVRDCLDAR